MSIDKCFVFKIEIAKQDVFAVVFNGILFQKHSLSFCFLNQE
jgi:hypothetical protein